VAVVGTIRRSSADCQVSGSTRLSLMSGVVVPAPIGRRGFATTGSAPTTKVISSWAETVSLGPDVTVGCGTGVGVGAKVCSATDVVGGDVGTGDARGVYVAGAAPPQATANTRISPSKMVSFAFTVCPPEDSNHVFSSQKRLLV
jgi:hypothetical protein